MPELLQFSLPGMIATYGNATNAQILFGGFDDYPKYVVPQPEFKSMLGRSCMVRLKDGDLELLDDGKTTPFLGPLPTSIVWHA